MAVHQVSEDQISLGTEAWNIADGYVKFKVLKQLILCDKLETIAQHGVEEIEEEFNVPAELRAHIRVNAINRLKNNLKQIFTNVRFAIRKDDEKKFEALRERISIVESMLDEVSYIRKDNISHREELVINEDWFMKMLSELQEIKESVNVPINSAGLIFRRSDELSFDELLKDISEGG